MPLHTLPPSLVRQATRAHPIQYPLEGFVLVVFDLDSAGSEFAVVAVVAEVEGVAASVVLGAVLAVGVATPEVVLPYIQGFEHLHRDKGHFQTPVASQVEANQAPELVLYNFLANTQADLEDFESGLASPAQEVVG